MCFGTLGKKSSQTVLLDEREDNNLLSNTPLLESEESETEFQLKKPLHPFIKLLHGLWPFGESFRALKLSGKIYEVLKVHECAQWSGVVTVLCYSEPSWSAAVINSARH